jgi:Galactose oxidase, central domain
MQPVRLATLTSLLLVVGLLWIMHVRPNHLVRTSEFSECPAYRPFSVTPGEPSTAYRTKCIRVKPCPDYGPAHPTNEAPQPVVRATISPKGAVHFDFPSAHTEAWAGMRVKATWAHAPDYPPGGMQDAAIAIINVSDCVSACTVMLVTTGWCGGGLYNNCEPRGFLNHTWLLNLTSGAWAKGPAFPGTLRQNMMCAQGHNGTAYCGGGYNFLPLRFAATLNPARLAKAKDKAKGFSDFWSIGPSLVWKRMRDIPYVNAYPAYAILPNGTIVASLFCNYTGGSPGVGIPIDGACVAPMPVSLYNPWGDQWLDASIDVFPGTERAYGTIAYVRGSLFVFGGAYWNKMVLDNWKLDMQTGHWLPIATNPWRCGMIHFGAGVLFNRFVVLNGNTEAMVGTHSGLIPAYEPKKVNVTMRTSDIWPFHARKKLFACHVTNPPAFALTMSSDLVLYDVLHDVFINHDGFRKPVGMNGHIHMYGNDLFMAGGESAAGTEQVFIDGVDYSGRHFRGVIYGTACVS